MFSMQSIAAAGGFMAALGFALAGLLAAAHRRLALVEDPRIDEIEGMLPKSNCGACGVPGCRMFAEKLVSGAAQPVQCTVSAPQARERIAALLGVAVGEQEKRVARLACAGGRNLARQRARYEGLGSCRAAHAVAGGGKDCPWGCLGLADCAEVCAFEAIRMDRHGLPVVDAERCTACNDCVEVCPKNLFSLEPVGRRLWVACRNLAGADTAERQCEVACTACGKCVSDSAPGLIRLVNNLAVIDYARNDLAARAAIERCPTGAIVWIEDGGSAARGAAARKILRERDLPPVRQRECEGSLPC
ncbi:MAG: RnfABCDGE type electron transport complex subunit B [Rhodocyclaceae bacterium]